MAYHQTSFNKALENSDTKIILLNAIRASKRYPLSFSATGSVQASGSTSASLQAAFPFKVNSGTPFLPEFTLNPSAETKTGFDALSATNLETEKFINALNDTVDPTQMRVLIDKGWPEELVVLMFVREVQLTTDSLESVDSYYLRICRHRGRIDPKFVPLYDYQRVCQRIEEMHARLAELRCPFARYHSRHGGGFAFTSRVYDRKLKVEKRSYRVRLYSFVNDPRNECDFLAFLDIVRKYRLVRARFDSKKTKAGYSAKKKTAYYEKRGRRKSPVQEVKEEFDFTPAADELTFEIVRPDNGMLRTFNFGEKANTVGLLSTRSPYDMIVYVGELISAQLRENDPYLAEIMVGSEQEKAVLFRVESGPVEAIDSAVSVRHEGKVYSIPKPGVGEITDDRSLQVLALIKRYVVKGIEREDLPKSPQVVVGGG